MSLQKLTLSALKSEIDDLRKLVLKCKTIKGERGEKGDKGDKGEPGNTTEASSLVTIVDNTSEKYVTPVDGKVVFNVDSKTLKLFFHETWYTVEMHQ